jgi:hypothetical protein
MSHLALWTTLLVLLLGEVVAGQSIELTLARNEHSVGMLDNVTSLAYQAYYRLTNYTLTGNHRKVSM